MGPKPNASLKSIMPLQNDTYDVIFDYQSEDACYETENTRFRFH